MAYDEGTAGRVRRVLSGRTDVVEKKMVGGGLSFVVAGNLCCGVAKTALMIRVGAEDHDSVLAEPHVRPMIFGSKVLAGFVLVDAEGFGTERALKTWVGRALAFVSKLTARDAQ